MDETVLKSTDQIYRWAKPVPGATLIGTHLGQLVLTNKRLLFLSTGGSGIGEAFDAWMHLGFLGAMIFGRTRTSDLDLSDLRNAGSLEVSLTDIFEHRAERRADFANYLTIEYALAGEAPNVSAFMTKTGIKKSLITGWADAISQAKQGSIP